jgi:hypothetical protein
MTPGIIGFQRSKCAVAGRNREPTMPYSNILNERKSFIINIEENMKT